MCESCKIAADGPERDGMSLEDTSPGYIGGLPYIGPGKHCCEWPISCTCQHRRKGAWNNGR